MALMDQQLPSDVAIHAPIKSLGHINDIIRDRQPTDDCSTDDWAELTHYDDDDHELTVHDMQDDHVDGPTFAQAPVVYIDAVDTDASLKADSADLLALKSRRRRRPVSSNTLTSVSSTTISTTSADANVAFSGFEMSYVAPHEPAPVGVGVGVSMGGGASYGVPGGPSMVVDAQYQPRLSIPADSVGLFLQSLSLSFTTDLAVLDYVCDRLAGMGYDSIFALAFVSDRELAMAGIEYPQDQHAIRTCARQEFGIRLPPGPPSLTELVTMSKWLELCGIPRSMTTFYTTSLQHNGYDNVAHFESIGHDSRALSVFRAGHYHLFKHYLEHVLQQQPHHQQHYSQHYSQHQHQHHQQSYNMYYNTTATAASASVSDAAFHSTLLDDLVPGSGFAMSPAMHRPYATGHGSGPTPSGSSSGYYSSSTHDAVSDASFTRLMHDGPLGGSSSSSSLATSGPPMPSMKEPELRLLYEAVNMDEKTNPCRRGKKVEWSVIANNGMGDPRFAVLSHYTADQLEHNYVQHHEMPLHATARNSEWSAELIKLLWRVSQDTRCKNGTKTMWEQIAKGKTGVMEYMPLAKFSNSQLRSRYRTEFGDKRPQSRKKAREQKNAAAKAAAAQISGSGAAPLAAAGAAVAAQEKSVAVQKSAAKQKATAAKARKQKHDEKRVLLEV